MWVGAGEGQGKFLQDSTSISCTGWLSGDRFRHRGTPPAIRLLSTISRIPYPFAEGAPGKNVPQTKIKGQTLSARPMTAVSARHR